MTLSLNKTDYNFNAQFMESTKRTKVPLCQYLEWDSNFLGCRIARVIPNKLDPKTVKAILRWCRVHQIDCLYFLADEEDNTTIRLAEENKFHCVDIRMTFERNLKDIPSCILNNFIGDIRPSNIEDIIVLKNIARASYHNTRFYYDSNFPVNLVDDLYETWIEKSCKGYADVVLVAELEREVVGFISCHQLDPSTGQIGLVGIHPNCKGKGIGKALVNQSLQWFSGQGITCVRVVTQGRNIIAQRVYEICGFLSVAEQIWYHRWFRIKDMKF